MSDSPQTHPEIIVAERPNGGLIGYMHNDKIARTVLVPDMDQLVARGVSVLVSEFGHTQDDAKEVMAQVAQPQQVARRGTSDPASAPSRGQTNLDNLEHDDLRAKLEESHQIRQTLEQRLDAASKEIGRLHDAADAEAQRQVEKAKADLQQQVDALKAERDNLRGEMERATAPAADDKAASKASAKSDDKSDKSDTSSKPSDKKASKEA